MPTRSTWEKMLQISYVTNQEDASIRLSKQPADYTVRACHIQGMKYPTATILHNQMKTTTRHVRFRSWRNLFCLLDGRPGGGGLGLVRITLFGDVYVVAPQFFYWEVAQQRPMVFCYKANISTALVIK